MKKIIAILPIILLFFSCTKTVTVLKYDFMPRPIPYDSLLSDIPLPKTTGLTDYATVSINGGTGIVCADSACKTTKQITLPAGYLFSDKRACEYASYEVTVPSTNKRLAVNRQLLNSNQLNLYKADSLYNERILYLEKQNQRSWLENNMGYIGFAFGVIFAVLVEYGTAQAIK
jgi:hypothetical protein